MAAHYQPVSEQEVYDLMNVLDDRLSHSNSAVVMATVKLFLHLTLRMPATHQQVSNLGCPLYPQARPHFNRRLPSAWVDGALFGQSNAHSFTEHWTICGRNWLWQVLERIKDPLQTMISRDHYETAYAVLANFLLIVQRAPVIFSQVGYSLSAAIAPIMGCQDARHGAGCGALYPM